MRVVLEPVPSGPRDRPRWTHLGRRVSYGEPWVWRLGGGKGAGGCSDGDYTASRCVPGVSSCPSCETRRVGTGCGRARSHFFFLAKCISQGCKTTDLYARVGSECGWARIPRVPQHCGTIIFSSFSPSGEAFYPPLGSSSDCWIAPPWLAASERGRKSADAGAASSAPVGHLLFSCDGADGSRQSKSKPSISSAFTALGQQAGFCVDSGCPRAMFEAATEMR